MTCKYHACQTARPLNALEQPVGWHIPCLNAKHKAETNAGWMRSDAHKKAKRKVFNARARGKGWEVEA